MTFVPPLVRPVGPDEGRRLVQEPVFRKAAAKAPPHGRCLNAGSGTRGLYCPFLESFEEIAEIVNMDVVLPETSAHRSDPRHTDLVGSVTALPFEDRSFDWILCSNVLPWVQNDHAAAAELGRVLKLGAFALISVGTPAAPPTPLVKARPGYTLEALRETLAQGGLEILWHRYDYHFLMTRWRIVWRWQYRHLGHQRRSLMPRFVLLLFVYMDRCFPIGHPSDLVVLARRRP